VVGVAAEGVESLSEANLDLEAVAVEGEDLKGIEGSVGVS
jgi:hypothetical protein